MITRRESKPVSVGNVVIGGGAPIAIQSMCSTDTRDAQATLAQINALFDAGCEIVRVAIPRADTLDAFERIVAESPVPVVADIHFDHKLAIEAARRGAAKLRINPGNIGSLEHVDAVIDAAGEASIPIRIGVNAGSLADEFRDRDVPLHEKLAQSAISFAAHFSTRGFEDIIVSAKASSVLETVDAYRIIAKQLPHPLHIGITEAGTAFSGTIKSSVGLGILLAEGIGDTLRVSLTADPVEEIAAGWQILASLDIRRRSPELVSCPTCGRCEVDLIPIANTIAAELDKRRTPIKVAVMGCVVNGPGEAREADIGVAAGKGVGLIFAKGEPLRKVAEADVVSALLEEVDKLESEL